MQRTGIQGVGRSAESKGSMSKAGQRAYCQAHFAGSLAGAAGKLPGDMQPRRAVGDVADPKLEEIKDARKPELFIGVVFSNPQGHLSRRHPQTSSQIDAKITNCLC